MPSQLIKRIFLILLVFALSGAKAISTEQIEITQIKMPRVPPVSRTAAIYLTIHNQSEKPVTLLNVSTEVAHHAMLHQTKQIDEVVKMQHLDQLLIPANSQVELKRGGSHIMLMGLEQDKLGKPFELRLNFSDNLTKTLIIEY